MQSWATLIGSAPAAAPTSVSAGTTLAFSLADGVAQRDPIFFDIDASGAVTLSPEAMLAADRRDPAAGSGAASGERDFCLPQSCIGSELIPFAAGSAAFEFGSFITNTIAAARFIYASGASGSHDDLGYGGLGAMAIGNFALAGVGLVGLALTRRRDYIPPG